MSTAGTGTDAGTGADAGAKEAALGLAFYELLYDATPNLGAGNFQVLSSTPAAIVTAANNFLAESAGKNYSVVFLELKTEIRVLAFAHHSRRPRYWIGRLRYPND